MTVERVLRNTSATTQITLYNGSTAVEADGTVTVVAKKADGTTLFSTNATNDAAVGVYSVVIPPQATLNNLTLTWGATISGTPVTLVTEVEIVGGFYFSLAELRAADSALANLTRFPNQALIDARNSVESEFEDICHRAFVPRFTRQWITMYDDDNDGRGYYKYIVLEHPEPIRVTGAKIGNTSYSSVDTGNWETSGYIEFSRDPKTLNVRGDPLMTGLAFGNRVIVEYEYGAPSVPIPIKEKALRRARLNLLGMASTIDPRATTMNIPDIGSVNLATPGERGLETGIPDIDVVLRRYTMGGTGGVY